MNIAVRDEYSNFRLPFRNPITIILWESDDNFFSNFKITPQLLCYLNLEETNQSNSIDWAGLYAYTCVRNCKAANNGYAKEFIYKQDFVDKN